MTGRARQAADLIQELGAQLGVGRRLKGQREAAKILIVPHKLTGVPRQTHAGPLQIGQVETVRHRLFAVHGNQRQDAATRPILDDAH